MKLSEISFLVFDTVDVMIYAYIDEDNHQIKQGIQLQGIAQHVHI